MEIKEIENGTFKRKSDNRVANIVKSQNPNKRTVVYTMEFEDTKQRITVLEYCLLSEWVRVD